MDHLKEYLDYYCGLRKPGYAVLVTGRWGVGKTYRTKSILGDNGCYVSLFGKTNEKEVHSSVFMGMYPKQAKARKLADSLRGIEIGAGGVSLSAGSIIASVVDKIISEDVDPEKIIIFDDLERCTIQSEIILGVIDNYIHELGCKVVVLADETRLPETTKTYKEKIFGQTIRLEPNASEAFSGFLNDYEGNQKSILIAHEKECVAIFEESEVVSLRILQQMMRDLVRLILCLSEEQRKHTEFFVKLLRIFLALSSQVRAGNLLEERDIYNRRKSLFAAETGLASGSEDDRRSAERIRKANSKFASIDLGYSPIEDEIFAKMLFRGYFNPDEIVAAVNRSPGFRPQADVPVWRALMDWDELDEDHIQLNIDRLRSEFSSLAVSEIGDILHMFALELMFSSVKIEPRSYDEIVQDYLSYLNRLLDSGRFPRINSVEGFRTSYGGFGYWIVPECQEHFGRLFDLIPGIIDESWRLRIPEIRSELFDALSRGLEEYDKALQSHYGSVPVLDAISASEFVDCVLQMHPRNLQNVAKLINDRRSRHKYEDKFAAERLWIDEVTNLFNQKAEVATPIGAARIRRMLRFFTV